jgi:hypothetical protein
MKNYLLSLTLVLVSSSMLFSQSAVNDIRPIGLYEKSMLANIQKMDTASAETFMVLANNFERIANAEKTKWEPFYYAAYCYTALSFLTQDKSAIDAIADKADLFIESAEKLEKANADLSVLKAMVVSCRIMVDPMSRFQTKGREVADLLSKAKSENADNPRIYLHEAKMQLRTPEAFGGGAKVAKLSLEKSIRLFEKFIPANAIQPSWGYEQAKMMLSKMN